MNTSYAFLAAGGGDQSAGFGRRAGFLWKCRLRRLRDFYEAVGDVLSQPLAMEAEEVLRCHPIDGAVLMGVR
jgi:hypothetical protein